MTTREVDYASVDEQGAQHRLRGFSIATGALFVILHLLALLAVLAVLVLVVPVHRSLMEELGVALPGQAVAIVHLSQVVVTIWYVILGGSVLLDIALVTALSMHEFTRRYLLPALTIVILLVALLLVTYVSMAITVPLQ
jgi:type II secretory pathway component PulF